MDKLPFFSKPTILMDSFYFCDEPIILETFPFDGIISGQLPIVELFISGSPLNVVY